MRELGFNMAARKLLLQWITANATTLPSTSAQIVPEPFQVLLPTNSPLPFQETRDIAAHSLCNADTVNNSTEVCKYKPGFIKNTSYRFTLHLYKKICDP